MLLFSTTTHTPTNPSLSLTCSRKWTADLKDQLAAMSFSKRQLSLCDDKWVGFKNGKPALLKSVSLSIQLIIPKFPLSNDMIVYLTQISFQFPKFLFFSRGLKSKMVDIFFVIPAIIHHVFTAKMYLSSTCLECRKQGSRRRAWSMYYETVVCPVSMYTYRKYILKCTN